MLGASSRKIFYVANMSFKAFRENKILNKYLVFTVEQKLRQTSFLCYFYKPCDISTFGNQKWLVFSCDLPEDLEECQV